MAKPIPRNVIQALQRAVPPVQMPTIPRRGSERNKPCRCGSGRKFKVCCLRSLERQIQATIVATREERERKMAEILAAPKSLGPVVGPEVTEPTVVCAPEASGPNQI